MAKKKINPINILKQAADLNVGNLSGRIAGAIKGKPKETPPATPPPKFSYQTATKTDETAANQPFPVKPTGTTTQTKGGYNVKIGDKNINMSEAEWNAYQHAQGAKGNAAPGTMTKQVQDLIDYQKAQDALFNEQIKGMPQGIENQAQFDYYNQYKQKGMTEQAAAAQAELGPMIEAAQNQPIPEFQKGGSMIETGLAGATGAVGNVGLGAAVSFGAKAVFGKGLGLAAKAGPIGFLVATGTAAGLFANTRKNRVQDIKSAKTQSSEAMKYAADYVDYANNPDIPRDELVDQYEAYKREVFSAQAFLEKDSTLIDNFFVDTGKDELKKIEEWRGKDDAQIKIMDMKFYTALANPDPSKINIIHYDQSPPDDAVMEEQI